MQQRELTAAEFEELKAQATGVISIGVQEVYGGFIINGSINWRLNGQTIAVQQDTAIAPNYERALILVDRYLTRKQFDYQITPVDENVPLPFPDANTYPSEDKDSN